MIDIIIYGIGDLKTRLYVENILKENVRIVGYMDDDFKGDTFNYCPIINESNIQEIKFDYLILSALYVPKLEEQYKKLVWGGVEESKIIRFYYYNYFGFNTPLRRLRQHDLSEFDGFFFGMSHGVDGLFPHKLSKNIYRLCARGMDLEYQKRLLEHMINKKMIKGHYFIFELPYYIFNYSVQNTRFFKYRICYYDELGCLETCNNKLELGNSKYIEEYLAYHQVFNEAPPLLDGASSQIQYSLKSKSISLLYKEKIEKDFWDINETHMLNNINIWKEIVSLIRNYDPVSKIAVVVFPQSPNMIRKYIRLPHFHISKRVFYENVVDEQITLLDDFLVFKNRRALFKDGTHLNSEGADLYSSHLEEELCSLFY